MSASSSKWTHPEESLEASPLKTQFESTTWDLLLRINTKLSSFNSSLSLLEILHWEFQDVKDSLDFSQQQVETLTAEK